jgi:hypothetical protein
VLSLRLACGRVVGIGSIGEVGPAPPNPSCFVA